MRNLYVALGALVVIAGVVALALMFGPMLLRSAPQPTTTVTDASQLASTALGFVQPPYEDDYQMLRVAGYVDNRTTYMLSKVDIEIQLFDSKGARKEVVKYSVTDIPPKQRKSYETVVGSFSGPRTATIKVISASVVK